MKTFDEQIREMQAERQRQEFWDRTHRNARGEYIYARFVAWCNGYNDGNGKTDGATFDRYCDEQDVAIDFWKRKAIGETHFGERYEWNGKEWNIEKWKELTH